MKATSLIAAGIAILLSVAGCSSRSTAVSAVRSGSATTAAVPAVSREVRDQLLDGAIAVLGRLDDYEEQAAYAQVFDRLNQWSHALATERPAEGGWRLDPLYETLPAELRSGVPVAALESSVFAADEDVLALRDQRWLSDIASYARGDAIDDLAVAQNLFQWTVRALAISSDPPMVPTQATPGSRWFLPGEVLLAGRASSAQRAWVFLELLRHAGLDGVMLATGSPADGSLQPWIPALLSAGEAYLFEPTYGMPVPGPGGVGVATARQAAADPAILRGLSLPDRNYPLQAPDMASLTVLVPAAPINLARRMQMLDERLAGRGRMEITIDASALAARGLAALPGKPAAGRTRLWEFPWETLRRRRQEPTIRALLSELAPLSVALEERRQGDGMARVVRPLYVARLREFRGDMEGAEGAKAAYLTARPSAAAIAEALKRSPPAETDAVKRLYEAMKQDATYWLGVLTLNEGDAETAVDYLGRMTLEASPDGPWSDAARVNLARGLLLLGNRKQAVAMLEADQSPQRFGSRLLASRIGPEAAGNDGKANGR